MAKLPAIAGRLKIETLIEDREIINEPRPYLGLSGIGDPCSRKLWYGFRMVAKQKLTPRQHRLLNRGHREEPVIIVDLEAAGIKIKNTTDDQAEVTTGYGHIKGHSDGIADNVPDASKTTHLLEFKTANDKNFKKIKKGGYLT